MSVKYNYKAIVTKIASSERGAKTIQTYADKKFIIAKQDFLQKFDEHPVTESIEAGATNPDGDYLAAGLTHGNLFAFLGFPKEKGNPVPEVRDILEKETRLTKSKIDVVGNGNKPVIRVRYSVRTPRALLFEKTRLFWDNGLSWLYSMQSGISGLSHFLSKRILDNPDVSRSTGGTQSKKIIRSNDKVSAKYIYELLNGLVAKFRSL